MTFSPAVLTIISVLGVSAISLSGVIILLLHERMMKIVLPILVSISAGALLGDVFLHILPEMTEEGIAEWSWLMVLGGILASFILEKFIHWHHCHHVECVDHRHPLGVMNLVGDFLHNALDGILIAGSFMVSTELGIATTIAVLLHEIPQEIGDVGVLLYSGFSKMRTILFNVGTALSAVIGAVVVLMLDAPAENIASVLVPFAAGNFLYIAGSDLIPELHKETNVGKSFQQLLGILAGIGAMAALLFLE